MDDTKLVLLMVGASNRIAEVFKLFVLNRFNLSDNGRKIAMLLASAVSGMLVMRFWPGAYEQLSSGTIFDEYGTISVVLFGLALGSSSEVLWRLLKLGGKSPAPAVEAPPTETQG